MQTPREMVQTKVLCALALGHGSGEEGFVSWFWAEMTMRVNGIGAESKFRLLWAGAASKGPGWRGIVRKYMVQQRATAAHSSYCKYVHVGWPCSNRVDLARGEKTRISGSIWFFLRRIRVQIPSIARAAGEKKRRKDD